MTGERALEWEPCPVGEISSMVTSIRSMRRRRTAIKTSAVVVLLITVGVTGLHVATRPVEYDFGGIACNEVKQLASRYLSGDLAETVTARIDAHLGRCPNCGPLMDSMRIGDHTSHRDDRNANELVAAATSFTSPIQHHANRR